MSNISEGLLFGIGNPLLDIQATVEKSFLDKYGLKENDQILCDDKLVPIFNEMTQKYDVEYIAGGSTQNSFRIVQWIIGRPNVVTFAGCIGKDHFGTLLKEKTKAIGLNTIYQITDQEKTGTCACCIIGQHRSLCAHLAAANCFQKSHLDIPAHKELMEKAMFYYIAGFVLTVSPEAIQTVAQHACEHDKPFMMNLSAAFISQFFQEPLMEALPYVDVLFGNETEAAAFAKEQNFETDDLQQVALKIAALPKKNEKRQRMVVITQGAGPTIVAQGGNIQEFPVTLLEKHQIVDTNGAGDAFVGGFLSQYIQGRGLEDCIRCGAWAAGVIIQRSGCTFPDVCDFA